jgi:threonylcarbamoyladenosine tRNA methylthiotransferase MtaB
MNNMKIAFKTLGCKLNQYDTQLLIETARDSSFRIVDFDNTADIYVVNACAVTMNAVKESRNMVRRARRRSKNSKIIVTGCFPEEMKRDIQETDIFVDISKRDSFFRNLFDSGKRNISNFYKHTRAFVKIQTGCNRFCSYCIIPYLRGKEYSRPVDEIKDEIQALVRNGFKEISLTGVHIGRYNYKKYKLPELLKEIEAIEGLHRIRLGSLNPEEISNELIKTVADSHKVCNHFHISLQSGNRKIIKLMGRDYDPVDFSQKLKQIKSYMPDCSIGVDIITGFPSETRERFQSTYNYISENPFNYLHVFRYSPRKNTLAAMFPHQVKEINKKKRSALLRKLGNNKSRNFREKFVGKDIEVLVESKQDNSTNMLVGFSSNYIRVLFPPHKNCKNSFKTVRIQRVQGCNTYGKIV